MENINKEEIKNKFFMEEALKEAKKAYKEKEIPVGAVIVKDEKIVSKAYNKKEKTTNPTAHAEILAIEKAAKKLKTWRLIGTTMYVTLEPCFMCMGAIMEARIDKIVYAVKDQKRGAAGTVVDMSKLNKYHKIKIESGVCKEESEKLIKSFFKDLRKKGK